MLLTAIALVALCQAPGAQTQLAPTLPMGSRPELHQLVRSIQTAIAKGDVAEATKLGENLPKPEFTLGWDDSAVPENLRSDVDDMRDAAIQSWQRIPDVHIKVAPVGDVNISFAKVLPNDEAGLPESSLLTFGVSPRLNVKIGLTRGVPAQSILPKDAYMEIGHAIGAFLGNADDSLPGNCMYRNNRPVVRPYGPSQGNLVVASKNLTASDQIRTLIKQNKPIEISEGEIAVAPTTVGLGVVRQGLKIPLDFVIKNTGTGTLTYNLVPDCSCFSRPPQGIVAPGDSVTVRTLMNTTAYIGEVHKLLVLYSNDPGHPAQEIPVVFNASPPYRLYRPEGDTILMPVPNNTVNILMTVPSGSNVKPGQYEWSGFDAKVSMEAWSGSASDELLGEGSKPRKGYIFHIKFAKDLPPGRITGTLHVVTDDDAITDSSYNLSIQNGIVVSPESLFFGEMSRVDRRSFVIGRRSKAFKILGVETGAKCLKAVVNPLINGEEYRVDLVYDGLGEKGDFVAQVKIKTNDPTQPLVTVSVSGTVL